MSKKPFNIDKSLSFTALTSPPDNPKEGDIYKDATLGLREYKDGVWGPFIGKTSGGTGFNYIESGDFEEASSVNDWTQYANTAAANKPDDFGGTASGNVTLTHTTTAGQVLRQTGSAKLSKDAANRQGEGVYYEFSPYKADMSQVLRLLLQASSSANYADGDIRFYFVSSYDNFTTIDQVIEPPITELAAGDGEFLTWFQVPAYDSGNTLKVRFCIHVASTNATAYDVIFDDIDLRKEKSGATPDGPVGEIIALPTTTPPGGFLFADGSEVSRSVYKELFDVVGTQYGVGDGSTTFNLPDLRGEFLRGFDDGRGVDPARVLGSTQNYAIQEHTHGVPITSSTNRINNGSQVATYQSNLQGSFNTQAAGGTETRPRNISVAYHIRYRSNTVLSSDAGLGPVAAKIYLGSAYNLANATIAKLPLDTAVFDNNAILDAANNRLVIQKSGFYDISAMIGFSGTAGGTQRASIIYVNGSEIANAALHPEAFRVPVAINGVSLKKGDYVELYGFQNSGSSMAITTTSSRTFLSIHSAGPGQTVAMSERVALKYTTTAGANLVTGTAITFATKVYDDFNAWDGTTFTAPISGLYTVKHRMGLSAATASSADASVGSRIEYNGSLLSTSAFVARDRAIITGGRKKDSFGSFDIQLNKGDTVKLLGFNDTGSTHTMETGDHSNWIEIVRVK